MHKNAIQPMRLPPSRVASPQAGPLLRRTRAHLPVVCALSDTDFATFVAHALVASSLTSEPGSAKHYTNAAQGCTNSERSLNSGELNGRSRPCSCSR